MKFLPDKIPVLVMLLIPALLVPVFIEGFLLHVIVLLLLWVIASESLNFVTGFAGQLALGHAAFITIGGYVGALLMLDKGMSFWPALLIGGGSAFISGAILGLMAMRMRGDYLGMVTMGFGEIVHLLALNLTNVTRGPMGLPGIPRPTLFGYTFTSEVPYYYLALLMVVFTHWSVERMIFSRFGRACRAMRDNEEAAEAMGIRSYKYKVLAFCISSAYAGAVGAFYAAWITLFSPDTFQLIDSIMISAMITLGGIGSLYGPIPGAIGIGALPEILRPFTNAPRIASLRLAGVGLIMVVVLIFKPAGIFGKSTKKLFLDPRAVGENIRNVFGLNKKPMKKMIIRE
jgi:branched-chain amino acid transport system permease protein